MTATLAGTTIVITGASSGIGRATAMEMARLGANLVLAARREQQLEEVAAACRAAGVKAMAVVTDVNDPEACRRLIERAATEFGPVDVLVNNAGYAVFDTIEKAQLSDLRGMMETNYFGAIHCTQAALPAMLARGRGSIVNVASIAGIMGYERMGGYCATKFAMIGYSEALRDEVMRRGVRVSLICPSTTETEFFVKAEREKIPGASRLVLAVSPERVARAIADAAVDGTYRRIIPFTAAAFLRMKELAPRFAHMLMRRVSSVMQ